MDDVRPAVDDVCPTEDRGRVRYAQVIGRRDRSAVTMAPSRLGHVAAVVSA